MKNDLLDTLCLPEDIKKLNIDEETELCDEIRQKIIATVSKNGGHLSITATNYLQNFGLTPFHITMSYD